MEKKVKKGRGLRVFIALGVMCMLLMGLAVQAVAADSEPASGNLTMTLTVTENGKQVPMAQVAAGFVPGRNHGYSAGCAVPSVSQSVSHRCRSE